MSSYQGRFMTSEASATCAAAALVQNNYNHREKPLLFTLDFISTQQIKSKNLGMAAQVPSNQILYDVIIFINFSRAA